MADTIREQIISAYLVRLEDWTIGNGFNISCGSSVYRCIQNIESEDLPGCVLWPQLETVEQRYGQNICTMVIKIEGLSIYGEINPSIIREQLLGDVIKIMTDPAVEISSKIEEILYQEGGPAGIQKPEENVTAVYADFSVKYETKIGDPYHQ